MLKWGVIKKPQLDWSAPLIMVPKKLAEDVTTEYLLWVDFRMLNKLTIVDYYPTWQLATLTQHS